MVNLLSIDILLKYTKNLDANEEMDHTVQMHRVCDVLKSNFRVLCDHGIFCSS